MGTVIVVAVASVVGTLAGVAWTQFSLGRRDDRHWQRERELERMIWVREDANRTYDHRRQAYVDFLGEADRLRKLIETISDAKAANESKLDAQTFEDLTARWNVVVVYGTDKAQQLAYQYLESLQAWGRYPQGEGLPEDVYETWLAYLTLIRGELGVPDTMIDTSKAK